MALVFALIIVAIIVGYIIGSYVQYTSLYDRLEEDIRRMGCFRIGMNAYDVQKRSTLNELRKNSQ